MVIAAALCPAPPLLVSGLTGAEPVLPDLREACLAAVAELIASGPDVIAVVGAGEATRTWDAGSRFDPAIFAPGTPPPARHAHSAASGLPGPPGPPGPPTLPRPPAAVGVGAWLLAESGYTGERVLQSVAHDEPTGACAAVGASLARLAGGRVALLVLADGSARRGLKAPGYLDERSAAFDAEVERAVRDADPGALLAIDSGLASDLLATGRPAWQVLAGALAGRDVESKVRYCDDPFGVAYLVASLRVS